MDSIKRIPTKDIYGFVSGEFFRSFVIQTVPKMAMLIGSSVITGFGLAAIGCSPNVEASPELAEGIGNLRYQCSSMI